MRNKLGNISMLLGIVLIIAALSLFLHNRNEDARADEQSKAVLQEMLEAIETAQEVEEVAEEDAEQAVTAEAEEMEEQDETIDDANYPDPYDPSMKKMLIGGYDYIGYIVIPEINLQLPIMAEWDYTRLKMSPCRYTGSTKTDDLVIAGHNYWAHFSRIKGLQPGAVVYFTDMDGIVSTYEVVQLDVLTATAVEEMTSGEYDLTLFTCTYGGQSRFALRCDRVTE